MAAILALALAGCSDKPVVKEGAIAPSDVNLKALGQIYKTAQQSLSRPPRSAAELKPFAADIADLEKVLVSPNDNEPFVVVWGTDLVSSIDPYLVVIYEKTGKGGFRHALSPSGTLILSDDAFAKASFPPGHKPAGQ